MITLISVMKRFSFEVTLKMLVFLGGCEGTALLSNEKFWSRRLQGGHLHLNKRDNVPYHLLIVTKLSPKAT